MTLNKVLLGRRAAVVAVGLGLAALVGLVALGLGFWREAQLRTRRDLEAELSNFRSQIVRGAGVAREEADFERHLETTPVLVHGSDSPRAAAELQDRLREVAASCGGDVRSAQVLPFRREGTFDVVSIQTEIVVPAAKLPTLLYAVETEKPYIFVASADIVAPMTFDKNAIFDVQWVLRAYRWRGY